MNVASNDFEIGLKRGRHFWVGVGSIPNQQRSICTVFALHSYCICTVFALYLQLHSRQTFAFFLKSYTVYIIISLCSSIELLEDIFKNFKFPLY